MNMTWFCEAEERDPGGNAGRKLDGPGSQNGRRNRRITSTTPGGEHLAETSQAWLLRHQEKAQNRLVTRTASRLVGW